MKRKTTAYEEAPLCKCGCGEKVKWGKQNKCWNTYINTHQKYNYDKEKICIGCGKVFPKTHEYFNYYDKNKNYFLRERDNYQCQNPDCWGKVSNETLTIHHINYIKKDCHPLNLVTICKSCNSRANFNRKYWQEFYTKIITENFKEDGMTKKRRKIIKRAVQTIKILKRNERR